jgi:hypothetical protein
MQRRAFLASLWPPAMAAPASSFDVVIWDSTPGGITAAIAAARAGLRAVIVTEDKHAGGMQTSGLGNTNAGQRQTVGGMAREFHRRIHDFYVRKYGGASGQVKASHNGLFFEPHVAEGVFLDWLKEAAVELVTEDVVVAAEKNGRRITSLRTSGGRTIGGRMFIDASYEGDLLKLAGCSYTCGRESSSQYGEPLAGVRFPPSKLGEADHKLQAFDYRLCLTDAKENRVPFGRPDAYDRSNYAFLAARIKYDPPQRLSSVVPLNPMPNRKTDSRTGEWVGGSWRYPEADRAERLSIEKAHRDYSAGYIWFLLTDPSVPEAIRSELARWGLAKDEFTDNENWPYHIYVREARRLVGDYVMTQRDIERRFQKDSVALGNFYLDVHPVEMVVARHAIVEEGNLGNPPVRPYEIPYRALAPKRSEVENLLVPVCLSASHVAFSSIRMEPVWAMLGHAAGLAAAMAIRGGLSVQDVPTGKLRALLLDQGAILDARSFPDYWPSPPDKAR